MAVKGSMLLLTRMLSEYLFFSVYMLCAASYYFLEQLNSCFSMVCIYVHNISCVRLIRDHFNLTHLQYADMSPILIPQGYTKSYLDGNDALVLLLTIDTPYTNNSHLVYSYFFF